MKEERSEKNDTYFQERDGIFRIFVNIALGDKKKA